MCPPLSETEGRRGQRCVSPSPPHLQCPKLPSKEGSQRTSAARFQKHWILNVCGVLNLCLA